MHMHATTGAGMCQKGLIRKLPFVVQYWWEVVASSNDDI
jgi:hypothetical protein